MPSAPRCRNLTQADGERAAERITFHPRKGELPPAPVIRPLGAPAAPRWCAEYHHLPSCQRPAEC